MPYKTVDNLPDSVKRVMPKHAQAIYREAFNHAWDEYKEPRTRKTKESREETAHKVAWAAVKKTYVKKDDKWVDR